MNACASVLQTRGGGPRLAGDTWRRKAVPFITYSAPPHPAARKPLSLNDFQQTERADAIVSPFFFSPQLLLRMMPEGRVGWVGVDKTFVTLFSAPQLLVLGPSASEGCVMTGPYYRE